YNRAGENQIERSRQVEEVGAERQARRGGPVPGKRTRTERLALWSAVTSPGGALGPGPAEAEIDHQAPPAQQEPPAGEGAQDRMAGWGSPLGSLGGASGRQEGAAARAEDPEAIVAEQLAGGDHAAGAPASAAGQPQAHGGAGGRGLERKMALDVPPPADSGPSRLSGEAVTHRHENEIELGDLGAAIAGEQRAISLELPRPAHVPEGGASRREEAGASAEKSDCIQSAFAAAGSNAMGVLDSLEEQRQVQQQALTTAVEAACEQIAGDGRQQIEAAYDRLEGEIDTR